MRKITENKNFLGIAMFKLFIFVLRFFNAIFFTPILLSACFIIFSFVIFLQDKSPLVGNFVAIFFKDGVYTEKDIVVVYSKYAFFVSLALAFIETILNKKFVLSARKRFFSLLVFFTVGYSSLFVSLVYFSGVALQTVFVLLILWSVSIFFAVIYSSMTFLINQFSKLKLEK